MNEPSLAVTWRGFGASATGTSHAERGAGCEDAHVLLPLDDGGLVIAVADGAGSARQAERGAWAAVEAAGDAAAEAAEQGDPDPARTGVEVARQALEDLTASHNVEVGDEDDPPLELRDLACTLLVAVIRGDRVQAAQVGDGAVIVRRPSGFTVLVAGERGEYLNETCFLTSSGWEADLRCESAAEVDAIAVMTDGLQLLAMDMGAGTAHPAFFEPLLKWASGKDPDGRDLVLFLGSEKVNSRTDDDKTLVLAVAVESQ